ncbi:MAG: hypothetical protein JWQ35_217 [Bacteriovoracaceae bacterium]|nr:hypothetical protein [Bacteriovoracaceae bacterium]
MLLNLWNKLSPLPFGKKIFSLLIGWYVPYTGSISPQIKALEKGKARLQMKDRRRVRNHLRSVHAIALMNMGEATTGLAVMSYLPPKMRAILVHLEIDFLKKARGTLEAYAEFNPPQFNPSENKNYELEASIQNINQETVAKVKAHWRIGPDKF